MIDVLLPFIVVGSLFGFGTLSAILYSRIRAQQYRREIELERTARSHLRLLK